MKYKIKKGDCFRCIEDFEVDNGEIAYSKNKVYYSEVDDNLTDNSNDVYHTMTDFDEFFEYFERVSDLITNDQLFECLDYVARKYGIVINEDDINKWLTNRYENT